MRLLFSLLLCCSSVYAQQLYWVEFTQKDTFYSVQHPLQYLSEAAILRRQKFGIAITESDFPVSNFFIQNITQKGYTVISKSKWLNGCVVLVSNKKDADSLMQFPFVKKIKDIGAYETSKSTKRQNIEAKSQNVFTKKNVGKQFDSAIYGKAFKQINMLNANSLHKQGFKGEGINIAVLDAGFNNADTLLILGELRAAHRLKMSYDFVQRNDNVFDDDDHGMAVVSCMAGYLPYEFVGTAPAANYYLFRTEDALSEMPIEELYWTEAIEFADSLGVDLVNSSLGYNQFDDVSQSYTHKDLDGQTAYISKAASIAVSKGIVVVVSAGNEGNDDWKLVSVPADVATVITVGGVDEDKRIANFSSIGPTADKRMKPDVMAQADNVWVSSSRGYLYKGDGTSYSSPLMAGSVACLMQANPLANPQQIMDALHQSGSHYFKPDNNIGYGIPDMELSNLILKKDTNQAILDVKLLSDKRVHLAFHSNDIQKILIEVKNAQNEIIHTENINIKTTGATRFRLKKIKKLKKGMYSLHFVTHQNEFSSKFIVD